MGEGSARVVLELEPGEPISGSVCGPTGTAEPFRGWLELTSALERARSAGRPGRGDEREPGDGRD
jgi:hypothetical protein